MGKFIVLIDTREKRNFWQFSMYDCCERVERKKLDVGDVTIDGLEDKLCIERKRTTGELSLNLGKDRHRFFKELEKLSKFTYKYLVCEFSLDDVSKFPEGSGIPEAIWPELRISGKYLLSCICKIQTDYGIEVVFASDNFSSEEIVMNILKDVYAKENP